MTISDTARGQVFQQEGGGFIILLVVTHDTLPDPLRFCDNITNIVSNGDTYIAFPFTLKLPDEQAGGEPVAHLVIDNVNREIVQTLRTITTAPSIAISAVRIDDLDAVEVELPNFKLRNFSGDNLTIEGDLTIDDATKEPFPGYTFTPSDYPGLFAN